MSDVENYVKIAIKNLNRVDKLLKSQKFEETEEIINSSLDILKDSPEKIKYAEACFYNAELKRMKRNYHEAANFYIEAAKIYSESLISELTASMLKEAIKCYQETEDITNLKTNIDEAIKIARPVCYKQDFATILTTAGNIMFKKKNWNDSIMYLLQAAELGGNALKGIEQIYYTISICFFQLCKWIDSILNGKIVLGFTDISRNPSLIVLQTILISKAYMRLFDYDNAVYYSSKAAEYFDRFMDIQFVDALINHLEINYFFKKISYASKTAEKYLETIERLKYFSVLPELLLWMGRIEAEVNIDNAINYLNEAIERSKEFNNMKIEQAASMEIAKILISYGRISEATELMEKYESLANRSDNSEIKAEFYEKKGLLEYIMRNYENALVSFQNSSRYYHEIGNLYEEINALYNCACIYSILNNERELYPLLQRIVNIDIRFAAMARADPDFASRYNDPDFVSIVGEQQ